MARDPTKARPPASEPPKEGIVLLKEELRRRGMTEAEIEAVLRKKKRRKIMEVAAVRVPAHGLWAGPDGPMPRSKPAGARPVYRASASQPSEEICTVAFAAQRLKLHPKTVLRFIREGRLRGTPVGKSYRILRTDLEAFAGVPAQPEPPVEPAWVTSIVDIPGVGADLAQTWARTVTGALMARPSDGPPLRADVAYEPERSHLKIIVVGAPVDTLGLLTLIKVWLEQLRP